MILIYGKENCSWCDKAKKLAEDYKLKYKYLDVKKDGVLDLLRSQLPEVKTVPQIWWGDKYIGGYESFSAEIENTLGANYGQGEF